MIALVDRRWVKAVRSQTFCKAIGPLLFLFCFLSFLFGFLPWYRNGVHMVAKAESLME